MKNYENRSKFTPTKIYDNHTLTSIIDYNTEIVTLEEIQHQVLYAFNESIQAYKEESNHNQFDCNIMVSVDLLDVKRVYIFLTNSQAYNMFLGKTPDGKEIAPKRNWDNVRDREEVEPLIPTPIVFGSKLRLDRACVPQVGDNYVSHILKTKGVDEDISEQDLKHLFSIFASDSKTKHKRSVKGTTVFEAYPYISIDSSGVGFVIFDENTTDAQFALLFNRELVFEVPCIIREEVIDNRVKVIKRVQGIEKKTLRFNHSYRKDDDRSQNKNVTRKIITRAAMSSVK